MLYKIIPEYCKEEKISKSSLWSSHNAKAQTRKTVPRNMYQLLVNTNAKFSAKH